MTAEGREPEIAQQFLAAGRRTTAIILITIAALTLVDISVDLLQGVEMVHVFVEAAIIPLCAYALFLVWKGVEKTHEENSSLRVDIAAVTAQSSVWKHEASRHLSGLSAAIDLQLSRWNLSASEKEVALLLLKGLSHKEVAEVRGTTERTARQQALAVYEKSGLSGRAQLAAFFLEDLLTPVQHEPAHSGKSAG